MSRGRPVQRVDLGLAQARRHKRAELVPGDDVGLGLMLLAGSGLIVVLLVAGGIYLKRWLWP